nr:olfactory receptor 5M11-like [Oryctolagus cuniculus]
MEINTSRIDVDFKEISVMNNSTVMESILLGITDCPELQPFLFVLFLVVYLVTLLGNLGLIMLIRTDSRLHTPMYYLLTNLAFVDLCYASNATPQMLTNFLSGKKTISFVGCFTQCYIFIALLLTEFYMLAAMAYDWISATLSNSFTIILVSYAFIIAAILWFKSSEGQQKTSSSVVLT